MTQQMPGKTWVLVGAWFAVSSTLLVSGRARGQTAPPLVEVTAAGTCPAREAVMAAVAPVAGPSSRSGGPPPRVADLGDRFEVSAAGQRAQYVDPARDCMERARIAAVFIALALNPPFSEGRPSVAPPAPPPPPAPPAAVAPAPAPAPAEPSPSDTESSPAPIRMAFGMAGRADGATLGSAPAATAIVAGGELRATVERRWLGAFAAAGILSPSSPRFDSVTVQQQRFPFSVGVTALVGEPGSFRLAVDVGLALALLRLRGEKLASASSETRLDAGGRVAVGLRFPGLAGGRIAAFTDAHAEFYPRPYHLDVDPLGSIGTTSRLWLGASVGAWWQGP